ncbi:MAG: transcription-repair coupling factor, partial [Salinisphaeraceae bacterium]|nr:transcription-repair coupling factor [Salinisphaeraceae bacterium]
MTEAATKSQQTTTQWTLTGNSRSALEIARAAVQTAGPMLVVAASEMAAYRLQQEIRFFAAKQSKVMHFPDWETLAYDLLSPHQDIISERLSLLNEVPRLSHGIVVVAADTLQQRLPPRSYVDSRSFVLKQGDKLDIEELRARLEAAGYEHVKEVRTHGEYAQRGALLDLYPMGSDQAYRIELFDDEVDSLRSIDPETQRSIERLEEIRILPAREFPLDKTGIESFRARYRARFSGDLTTHRIYEDVSQGLAPPGIEAFLPLFFEQTASLLDYLPENCLVVEAGDIQAALETSQSQLEQRYEQYCGDIQRPILLPDEAFIPAAQLKTELTLHKRIQIHIEEPTDEAGIWPEPVSADLLGDKLKRFIEDSSQRVLLTADSAGRRELLLERLQPAGLRPAVFECWADFLTSDVSLGLCVAPLEQAFSLDEPPLCVLPEAVVLGVRPPAQRRRRAQRDASAILRDLTDLSIGAPIVHQDHGVGRFLGLQHVTVGGQETEFLTLEYADEAKLYVPVANLHLVHRYTGAEGNAVPVHRLGSDQWEKARKRAAQKARDAAAELLEIQARRAAQAGVSMQASDSDYQRFCDQFPFEETPDQAQAIEQVIDDLKSEQPTDRVVCGDVGFGKTEVAMRAAFVAVQSGQQVAVLVPTTLLAQQHAQNFADRFADWPVRVGCLSRMGGSKAQQQTLNELESGKLDIVIGTHKLLQTDVKFKRLGLVIVDEEHRFGVRHKERLKQLRANVDLLTLTATPIPRTLNMSLSGLRDLSIIATPPVERHAVQTQVTEWNGTLIREACLREIKRGGQVYFLHNRVEDIERIAREVAELVPEASIRIAHGQMRERELEAVMLDFYHQRFNILVCTTIVESGIDVPSANTILMNRADRLGLAQLHQLRGRVGRSHHRAYAYLIVPEAKSLTRDAKQRLDAIASLGELGAGFMLATQDMEIRGAGELLGEDQSGQIEAIGITLYTQLLERAKRALSSGELGDPDLQQSSCEIDLSTPALLPADYVPDVHARLVLYKRISNAADESALRELQVELIDRFGLLPEAAEQLFAVTRLKLQAEPLGIKKIEAGDAGGRIVFNEKPSVDPARLIQLIQTEPQNYKLDGNQRLLINHDMPDAQIRHTQISELLKRLS